MLVLNYYYQQMINSYFQSSVNRPSFPRNYQTSKTYIAKNTIQTQYNRYKLFIIVIAKATARVIKSSFQIIHQNTKIMPQAINKIAALTDKNINLTVFLAFQKLKVIAGYKKKDLKAVKNVVIWLQRMEKYKIKQAFSRIVLHCFRLDKKFIETFHSQRTFQFTRKLAMIFKHKKKSTFQMMVNWSNFIKSFSKLRVILVIRNRLQRQAKQNFLIRLNRMMVKKSQKQISSKQISQLKIQLQDMNVQLQNKNESIQRLQTEISQYKIQQSNLSYNNLSYGQYNNNSNRSKQYTKAHSVKKMSFTQKSIAKMSKNQSHDNISINDISIGSILGNLNKSRTDSASKFQQSYDCSCGFKPKYKKYRNLYDSLKNQLQIVKEQLEVAKDLNEHFTNQIKQYLSGENNQGDYQKLKRQHSLLQEERDQLREKVFKYQKHINNLKAEFKVKMEQLYRKVRKDM